MDEKHVVTCFLEQGGKIALLKRSQQVGTYRGIWAGVSGYIEEGNSPLEQALQEMKEEAGLNREDVQLVKEGIPLGVFDLKMERTWIVHPFRFVVMSPEKIVMDWENTEINWIEPGDIGKYETVPNLRETWGKVAGEQAE